MMKVKELVKELQKYDDESDIGVFSSVFPDFDMKVVDISIVGLGKKPTIYVEIVNTTV